MCLFVGVLNISEANVKENGCFIAFNIVICCHSILNSFLIIIGEISERIKKFKIQLVLKS